MDIIGRIDELCSQRGITKYRLSQMTGISQSAFSKMKREQNTLSQKAEITRISPANRSKFLTAGRNLIPKRDSLPF